MIDALEIMNFRGVKEGGVEGLSALSILVGPNNCGKSTVLEALSTLSGANASTTYRPLMKRGGPAHDAAARIVGANRKTALIIGRGDGIRLALQLDVGKGLDPDQVREARSEGLIPPYHSLAVEGSFTVNGSTRTLSSSTLLDQAGKLATAWGGSAEVLSTVMVDVLAVRADSQLEDAFSAIQRAGRLKEVLTALKKSMPRLEDMQILKSAEGGEFLLNLFVAGAQPIPAYLAGDGLKRFMVIAAACLERPDPCLVLLEEPESFQHPRYLAELVHLLLELASPTRQIVVATHSIELIDCLLQESAAGSPFPTVHRLRLHDGNLRATTLTHAQATAARDELLQDLRA